MRPALRPTHFSVGDPFSGQGPGLLKVQNLRKTELVIFEKPHKAPRLAGFGIERAQKNALIKPCQIGDHLEYGLGEGYEERRAVLGVNPMKFIVSH